MQLKQLLQDDDAVSPVIGVILMVAITVILAAVIATFVLGLGDQVSDTSPQASFSFQWDGTSNSDDPLTITHDGGDSIKAKNIYIRGNAGTDYGSDGDVDTTQSRLGQAWYEFSNSSQGETQSVTAGQGFDIGDVGPDAEIDVIWELGTGEKSATLSDYEGPDA